jgi:MOSC domain-containing protein YiiM
VPGTVTHIFIAAVEGELPHAVDSAAAHAGRGIEGDRNFSPSDQWIGSGNALTLIESEVIEAVAEEHELDVSNGRSRRQVVTRGVRLNDLVGKEFSVGEVRCRGVELCEPCRHLQNDLLGDPRAIKILVHRGGLRADILEGGTLRVGDAVG